MSCKGNRTAVATADDRWRSGNLVPKSCFSNQSNLMQYSIPKVVLLGWGNSGLVKLIHRRPALLPKSAYLGCVIFLPTQNALDDFIRGYSSPLHITNSSHRHRWLLPLFSAKSLGFAALIKIDTIMRHQLESFTNRGTWCCRHQSILSASLIQLL